MMIPSTAGRAVSGLRIIIALARLGGSKGSLGGSVDQIGDRSHQVLLEHVGRPPGVDCGRQLDASDAGGQRRVARERPTETHP